MKENRKKKRKKEEKKVTTTFFFGHRATKRIKFLDEKRYQIISSTKLSLLPVRVKKEEERRRNL